MSKVKIDFGAIETNALPAIDNATGHINEAIAALQQAAIPSDFSKLDLLKSTFSNLKTYTRTLNNTKTWLVESNKNYNSMIDKLELQANKMPVDQVKKRNTII